MFDYLKALLDKDRCRLPLYLVYHVTYRCNAACRFCFLAGQLNRRAGEELTLVEIEAVCRSLPKLLALTIGGGEPFLREDLAQVCALFVRHNEVRRIAIPTNGSMPDRIAGMVGEILAHTPQTTDVTVGLSLDGVGERHDQIRRLNGGFDKLIQTYERLTPLRERFSNFSVGILTTISPLNLEAVQEIGDFVRRRMQVDWHSYELMRGETREPLRPISAQDYARILPYIRDNTNHYQFGRGIHAEVVSAVKRYQPRLVMQTLREQRQVIPCYAGRINGVLGARGSVSLCELMPPVGNVRDSGFDLERIWWGEQAEVQRSVIRARRCYCTHCIFQNTSILFSPQIYPAILHEVFSRYAQGFSHSACI